MASIVTKFWLKETLNSAICGICGVCPEVCLGDGNEKIAAAMNRFDHSYAIVIISSKPIFCTHLVQ